MNDKNGWIAIGILTTGLAALSGVVGLQYANQRGLSERFAAQRLELDALRNSDTLLQSQLAAHSEENTAMTKQLGDLETRWREQVVEIQARQTAIGRTINLFAPATKHGQNIFLGIGAGPRDEAPATEEGNPNAGSFNTALGTYSLNRNATGAWNAAIGTSALGLNEAGSNNLAAGANALGSNRAGSANVALGSAAMYRNLTGAHNSAVGMQALYHLETGDNNSAFGRDALFTIRRGSWNSAFGVDSLPGLEIGVGNSAFGGESGYTENRDFQHRLGSFNSWFGYQSGPATLKQVSNSIAVGYRAKNTDSNQTVIGNSETKETIIFGDLKIDRLCVGATCADAGSFAAMLKAGKVR